MSAVENMHTIESIVAGKMCTGCGTCAGVCEQGAITMHMTCDGLLLPTVDREKCIKCGSCEQCCPGAKQLLNGLGGSADSYAGVIRSGWLAQARDETILERSQSGGFVTATLIEALRLGVIDGAVLTRWCVDQPLRAETFIARTEEEIRSAQKSKYCPVAAGEVLRKVHKSPCEKIAFVGLGCQVHGLQLAAEHLPAIKRRIAVRIGLFCDRNFTLRATDYLVKRTGLSRDKIAAFSFRDKAWRGYPGDVRVVDKRGRTFDIDRAERHYCKMFFTPVRCRLCFDTFNRHADISVGDAWGLYEGRRGKNAILVRTLNGELFLSKTTSSLELEEVPFDRILKGQQIEEKRRQRILYTLAWKWMGHTIPDLNELSTGRMRYEGWLSLLRSVLTLYFGQCFQGRLGSMLAARKVPRPLVRLLSILIRR